MKSLLIVTTIPATLRAFFIPITHHFQSQGWRVDGMAKEISANSECLKAFNQVWDVELSRNPLKPQNLIVASQQIQRVVEKEKYDLVLVSTPVAAFVTRFALNGLRKQGKPKIVYTAQGFHFYRGGAAVRNAIFLTLEKLAGQWTDYLVVVNREDEEAAKRYHLVPAERVRYIPGTGLNVVRFNPNAIPEAEVVRVRQELGIPIDAPLFLSVAEFIARKRPWDILKAFARLERTDAHLAFAGTGLLFDEMQQLASRLDIQDRVHFLGHRKDIPVLMLTSTATILASDQEGLPNCVMESLCMGTPAIGTEIRGTKDLLEGGCGILVKVGDVEGFTRAMSWMLDRPEETKSMGKRGQEQIVPYKLEHILLQYQALFAEVLQK